MPNDESGYETVIQHALCLLGVHQWAAETVNHDPLNDPQFEKERGVCQGCGVRK